MSFGGIQLVGEVARDYNYVGSGPLGLLQNVV